MRNFNFKKIIDFLFSTRAAGLYMLLFAAAIGIATFIENDFGTSSAQKVVFQTRWFEILLALFGISVLVNVFRFRMIQQKKWPLLTFHLSILVILLGAAVTRYAGYEGMMHIREGSASNEFLSAETYLRFEAVQNGQKYLFDEPVLFATLGNNQFEGSYIVGTDKIDVRVNNFVPNPTETMVETTDGVPTLKVVLAGANGREEYFIPERDKIRLGNLLFNFGNADDGQSIHLVYRNDSLLIKPDRVFTCMVMATQQKDTIYPGNYVPLVFRSLYSDGRSNFVVADFNPSAKVVVQPGDLKMKNESMGGVDLTVGVGSDIKNLTITGKKGVLGRPGIVQVGNTSLAVSYGAKPRVLPFSIKLYDFIMERYPGTNSASSYASEVQLIDSRYNLEKDFRIYMNNILNYKGYRFFQSSYDQDELGTYLSVNHDAWGTWISYLGYFLLTLGMVLTLFSKKTRFYQLSQNIKRIREKDLAPGALGFLLVFLLLPGFSQAQTLVAEHGTMHKIDAAHAQNFGRLIVQDYKGRMKPIHTLAEELLRKMSRKESLFGMSADQVFLAMTIYPEDWNTVPFIKIGSHEEIKKLIKVDGEYAAYSDFFGQGRKYLLQEEVQRAYNLQPIDRGTYEKELMKLDERVNISSMIFSGRFLKIFPVVGDPGNHWKSVTDMPFSHNLTPSSGFDEKFYPAYEATVKEATKSQDWRLANQLVEELKVYQRENGGPIVPSNSKVEAEILLNKLNVFNRLGVAYSLLGIAFLSLLFLNVFSSNWNLTKPYQILFAALVAGFLFHTAGLGIRWFVSGHAPWSNGYESMIYIGWTTILAGLIFARKSYGGLAATAVLAATILLVAHLSYLDPEITPLVPVLKSYWLTIHVSLEAGSYGFLMLGAIIGLINLILMIFLAEANKSKVYRMVREMSYISEMTLIGGLFMVSIGTYLGGVWANESWGRYWGWDAKETWALVTILVYSFILHMRFIPKFRGLYAFNVASLFGWASVIMTYYGVNYYLSGLHSYAAGDPVPVPTWVYITVIALVVISLLAFFKDRKFKLD